MRQPSADQASWRPTASTDATRICDLFAIPHDRTGILPPLPGVFPNHPAPIIRLGAGGHDLAMAFGHADAMKGPTNDSGVTNVGAVSSRGPNVGDAVGSRGDGVARPFLGSSLPVHVI